MDISKLPISATMAQAAKTSLVPKTGPSPESAKNRDSELKTTENTLTLTSYKRAPTVKADLGSWANRTNSSEIQEGISGGQARSIVWGSFARAKEDFHENPLIQRTLDKHDLSNKDWDFTVGKSGDIKVLEGEDKLSKDAINSLEYALNHSRFGYEFKKMAENLIHVSHAKHEDINYSYDNYNLTTENFSEVIKGRELMNTRRSDHNDWAFNISKQLDYAAEHSGLEEKERYIITKQVDIEA